MSFDVDKAILMIKKSEKNRYLIQVTQKNTVIFDEVALQLPGSLTNSLQMKLVSSMAKVILKHISDSDQTASHEVQRIFSDLNCFDVIDEQSL